MGYFSPDHVKSSGKTKYKTAVDVSDKHGLIRTFYFTAFANNSKQAVKKVKNKVKSTNYLGADHLTLNCRLIGETI